MCCVHAGLRHSPKAGATQAGRLLLGSQVVVLSDGCYILFLLHAMREVATSTLGLGRQLRVLGACLTLLHLEGRSSSDSLDTRRKRAMHVTRASHRVYKPSRCKAAMLYAGLCLCFSGASEVLGLLGGRPGSGSWLSSAL